MPIAERFFQRIAVDVKDRGAGRRLHAGRNPRDIDVKQKDAIGLIHETIHLESEMVRIARRKI